jgi:hypothetical protein
VNNEAFKTGDIMKKHLRVTAPFLFLLTVLFCAACAGQGGGDTTGAATSAPVSDTPVDTAAPAETTTSPTETEPETEPPTPELAPDAAASADGFVLAPVYTVAPNVREQNLKVNVGGTKIQIDITSTFFGTESAVDRDTHHWGDIIRYNDLRVTGFEEDFRVGDLNGDRCGELLTYRDRTLTVYALPKRSGNLTPVYTQKLGFAGILCGAGHLNEDGYTDLIFFDTNMRQTVIGLGGAEGFTYAYAGLLEGVTAEHTLLAGDIDDDGVAELVAVRDLTVRTYDYTVDGFTLIKEDTLPYAVSGQFLLYALSDMNSDGAADLVCFMKDPAGTEGYGTLTYMSRRDGHYGSYEHEGNNKNVNVTHIHSDAVLPLFAAGGDITRDGVDDTVLIGRAISRDRVSLYALVYPAEAPAYDYSSHVIKTADGYILYTGALYCDYNTDKYAQTDGDHIMAYTSVDGLTWNRVLDAPCFFLGGELGAGDYQTGDVFTDKWWIKNTMEPEVVFVDGIYYMYYQVENYCYDKSGGLMGADRIGVATSTDGIHFERKLDTPALITSDEYSCFTHQEVVYVPDDPDGKCFWMYVRYVHNNVDVTYIRIRTADPLCFDMDAGYDVVLGFDQGNQMGYINNYDGKGNRLFINISPALHTEYDELHYVPTLQFSTDGVRWVSSSIRLAGTDLSNRDEAKRNNLYFLGMSTINGTGEIAVNEKGEYEFFYVGCTANSPVAPGIFESSEGVGKAVFTVTLTN